MLFKRIIFVTLALVLLLSATLLGGCGEDKPGTYKPAADWCQEVANKITAIQPENIPGTLAQEGGFRSETDFNVNEYFKIFTHVSISGGYLLDYLYYITDNGGTPILYTRHEDLSRYETFWEYSAAGTPLEKPQNDVSVIWLTKESSGEVKYGSQVHIDQTSEGYYEYAVLQLLGGQFYLYHKARLYDIRIVCTTAEVESVLTQIAGSGLAQADETFKTSAMGLDLQPVVEIGEKTATVSLVVFTMWGGFSRVTFTMNRDYPHSVTGYQNENILKYDCGLTL
jgi:hypothetical protein